MGAPKSDSIFPRHLQRAINVAQHNEYYDKWRLGAVIVKGGNVVSKGHSRLLSDPSVCDFSHFVVPPRVSLHAEIDALRGVNNASGGVVYVARMGRNGKIAMARPCANCEGALVDARIKRVVYTIGPNEFGTWNIKSGSETIKDGDICQQDIVIQ